MRASVAVRYIGLILLLIGISILLSAGVGLCYHDSSVPGLVVSGLLVSGFGIFPMVFVPRPKGLTASESILVVSGAWVATSVAGAIPFFLWGNPFTPVNSLFESISGFTTTGASILADVESLPKGILFWRALTHWIGGTGIILFALAVLPALGPVSQTLLRQEYTSLTHPSPFPRARILARVIILVYVGLTVLQVLMLVIAKVGLFDATTTAFASISTGGFSVRNASIAAYNSFAVELIVILFMVLGASNFAFLYGLMIQRHTKVPGWEVFRTFIALLVIGWVITAIFIHGTVYQDWGNAFRYAAFQVATIATTTGFATADSAVWTPPAHMVLILVALIGACAGSTGGGVKIDRFILFNKLAIQRFKTFIHPQRVISLSIEGRPIKQELAESAALFIVLYLAVTALSTILLTFTGAGLIESFSGTVACIGNCGPGLGQVGSMGNYGGLTDVAKLILCVVMLIGRLEIFAMILPFTVGFWRR